MLMTRRRQADGSVVMEVKHTGISDAQHFATQLVEQGTSEGWMSLGHRQLTIHTVEGQEDLSYAIIRGPGRYCCHCGEKLPDDATGATARLHIHEAHGDEPSPDPHHPAGYAYLRYYDCVLDTAQHELLKAK